MTEEMKAASQALLERLHAARGELDELIEEQRRLTGDLERAPAVASLRSQEPRPR